jgi:triacylglycerol lipase
MVPTCLTAMAASLAIALLASGIFVYVAATYVLMLAHVERRPVALAIREALREVVWVALTQPVLPLFYLFGRRLAPGLGTPVVVVHGYAQNRVDFLRIARACARSGLGPVYGFNYPWFASIHTSAERLARFVERVRQETGADQVDLVAHSLGGLVAMEYVHEVGPSRVRRIVTIACPHAGVAWRGPIVGSCGPQVRGGSGFLVQRARRVISVPCLNLYSTHDNVVHPPSTSPLARRGARDLAIPHVGHLAILFHPEVARAVVGFLRAGSAVALEPTGELARA